MRLLTKMKRQISVLLVVLVAMFATPVLAAPVEQSAQNGTTEYEVQPGDNLSHLGRRFGMHPSVIIGANPQLIFRPNVLIPGETLIIPGVHYAGGDSIADVIAGDSRLSTFLIAARTAELLDDLDYVGRYSVFVPTNAAFQQLSSSARGDLLNDLAFMNTMVQHHIVPERYDMAALSSVSAIPTYGGGSLIVNVAGPNGTVNGVPINVLEMIETANGVVYVIPAVLPLPDGVEVSTNGATIDFASTFDVDRASGAAEVVTSAVETENAVENEVLGVELPTAQPTPASQSSQSLTVVTASSSGSNMLVAPGSVVLSCGSMSVSLANVLSTLSGPMAVESVRVAHVHYHRGYSSGSAEACVTFRADIVGGEGAHSIKVNNVPVVARNAHIASRADGDHGEIEFDVLADCNQAYSFAFTVESGDGQQATHVFNHFIPCP